MSEGRAVRLPVVLRRLLRSRARAVAYGVFVLLVVLSAGIGVGSGVVVRSAINAQWRGAFDILVTPKAGGTVNPLGEVGLLDPNFASVTSAAHIPLSDVSRIAQLAGVSVAAPIGFLGRVTPKNLFPALGIPLPAADATAPTGYRVQLTVRGNDGTSRRVLQDYSESMILGPNVPHTNGAPFLSAFAAQSALAQFVVNDQAFVVLKSIPIVSSTVVAVDPVAEQKLLGAGGKFLGPLRTYDRLAKHTGPLNCRSAGQLSGPWAKTFTSLTTNLGGGAVNSATRCIYGASSTFAPYVRNASAYPPMTLTATFSRTVSAPTGVNKTALSGVEKAATTRIGTTTVDLSSRLRPFSSSDLAITWPGQTSLAPDTYANPNSASTVGPLRVDSTSVKTSENGRVSARVLPQGILQVDGSPGLSSADLPLGATQSYRDSLLQADPKIGSVDLPGAAPLEVGSYDPSRVRSGAETNDTPLGAYDPAAVHVGTGTGPGTAVLEPTLSGLGVAAQSASAITSIAGAKTMGVADPVDAIRVRVAGVHGYSDASVRKIAAVARKIAAMGFSVHVVSGSSSQAVLLHVPGFVSGPVSAGGQPTLSDLGTATRSYTKLGAATAVQANLGTLTSALFLASVIAAVALLILAHAMALDGRRESSGTMSVLGISRRRRFWWLLSEDTIPIAVIAGCVLAVIGFQGFGSTSRIVLGATAAAALSACAFAWAGSREPDTRHVFRRRARSRTVTSRAAYALRQTRSPLWLTLSRAAAIALVSLAASLVVALIPDLLAQTSSTRLGTFVVQASAPLNIAAACLVLASAVAMLITLERNDATRRLREYRTLLSSGWTPADLRRSSATQLGIVFVLAAILSAAGIAIEALTDASAPLGVQIPALAALLIVAAVVAFLSARRNVAERGQLAGAPTVAT